MTKICRFDDDRLGLIEGDTIIDVTDALGVLPEVRWPIGPGDLLIRNLDRVLAAAQSPETQGDRLSFEDVKFKSPIANPSKIIGAPVNYRKHQDEANADGGKNFESVVKAIDEYGLFLKANSSLIGTSEAIEIAFPERRTDHEIELVVVIGREGRNIARADALNHVAGYSVGLDVTVRGTEDRSLRKSLDTFAVLGPWLVTSDEVRNPNQLEMSLSVNGDVRQRASTADLIFDVEKLIEYASSFYTLNPGDLIFTGTPEGVGPVVAGDTLACSIEGIGTATVRVMPRQR